MELNQKKEKRERERRTVVYPCFNRCQVSLFDCSGSKLLLKCVKMQIDLIYF